MVFIAVAGMRWIMMYVPPMDQCDPSSVWSIVPALVGADRQRPEWGHARFRPLRWALGRSYRLGRGSGVWPYDKGWTRRSTIGPLAARRPVCHLLGASTISDRSALPLAARNRSGLQAQTLAPWQAGCRPERPLSAGLRSALFGARRVTGL